MSELWTALPGLCFFALAGLVIWRITRKESR